jgi:hypothetical protein
VISSSEAVSANREQAKVYTPYIDFWKPSSRGQQKRGVIGVAVRKVSCLPRVGELPLTEDYSPTDPRRRCPVCFKLLTPRIDGCFRVHTISGDRVCVGSGDPAEIWADGNPDYDDWGEPSLADMRRIAAESEELEEEQLAAFEVDRRSKDEIQEGWLLREVIQKLPDAKHPVSNGRKYLKSEAGKWLRREAFWQARISALNGLRLDAEICEAELEQAREALAHCAEIYNYIMVAIAELDTMAKSPRFRLKQGRNLIDQVWSVVQRWRR